MAYTTIDDPSAYFKVQLYTGNGSANHAITFDDTDTDMQPDLVWIKNRDTTDSHCLFDSVRGATKVLHSDATTAEVTDTDTLDSFASDGFQVDADVKVNTNTEDYVAWCWKEASGIMDIVAFEGDGSARTVSHSLSAVPGLIITKNRELGSSEWPTYHHKNTSAPETERLFLSGTQATLDNATFWNDTAPTSSVFSVATSVDNNQDTKDIIAYLFAEKQGFSKFGSYTGNGSSTEGAFIYTGFRPAYLVVKRTDSTNVWSCYDNKRNTFNIMSSEQELDANKADQANSRFDLLSNGFQNKTGGSANNTSGGTYVYIAFAEAPLVNSEGVPATAR